jgi:hypothetical protein
MATKCTVTVFNGTTEFKKMKSRFDGNENFSFPLAKETYWKVAYDVNRAGHQIEKAGGKWTIKMVYFENDVLESEESFTTRQGFYNAIRQETDGLKRYNARKEPTKIVNNFKHSKKSVVVKPAKATVAETIAKVTRADLVAKAKELGIKGYSDMNMKQIAEAITAKAVA